MLWVEIDMYEPQALRQIKDGTSVPITSGENLYGLRDYRPYFEARSMDNVMSTSRGTGTRAHAMWRCWRRATS